MKLSSHLEFDLIAVESDERVSLLLELTAPGSPEAESRAPRRVFEHSRMRA